MSDVEPCTALTTGTHCLGMARGNRPAASRYGQYGFTLIELMVTIIVIAILATAALPSFRSFIVGQRVKSASFDAMSALSRARSEAITRNANVNVAPNGGNWLQGWTVAVGGTILQQQPALPSGLAVTCYSGTTVAACQAITYSANGRLLPGTPAQSILIAANDASTATGSASRCIGVDPSGRPRSTKGICT